jgi:hypothetical protein
MAPIPARRRSIVPDAGHRGPAPLEPRQGGALGRAALVGHAALEEATPLADRPRPAEQPLDPVVSLADEPFICSSIRRSIYHGVRNLRRVGRVISQV